MDNTPAFLFWTINGTLGQEDHLQPKQWKCDNSNFPKQEGNHTPSTKPILHERMARYLQQK